jgi:hypothetical protein
MTTSLARRYREFLTRRDVRCRSRSRSDARKKQSGAVFPAGAGERAAPTADDKSGESPTCKDLDQRRWVHTRPMFKPFLLGGFDMDPTLEDV